MCRGVLTHNFEHLPIRDSPATATGTALGYPLAVTCSSFLLPYSRTNKPSSSVPAPTHSASLPPSPTSAPSASNSLVVDFRDNVADEATSSHADDHQGHACMFYDGFGAKWSVCV